LASKFDAIIFDMDGTIIEQMLDFRAIRQELGIPGQDGILEAIGQMPADQAARAEQMLLNRELTAASNANLMSGASELLKDISDAGLKTALLTRNAREAMEIVLDKFALAFDLAWARDNGPIKPEPDGILRACLELGVTSERTCCVGDFHYDIIAANAAGATSVLLAPDRPSYADQADHVIGKLDQLPAILGL